MKIESLKLTNFRNYFDLNLQFDDKMNIFIGDNGAGKTNILESIYILSFLITFFITKSENMENPLALPIFFSIAITQNYFEFTFG